MRSKNKILKFIFILLSIFLNVFAAVVEAKQKNRARDEERAAQDLQEQESTDFLTSRRQR